MSVTEIGEKRNGAAGDEEVTEDEQPDARSIEDRAADGEAEEPDEGEQMQFPGTQSKLNLNAGGARPTSALAKIAAISLPMPPTQQMDGEEEVIVSLRCKVNFVGFRTLKKGGKQREHTLVPVELLSVAPSTD